MLEETTPQAAELSLRDYMDLLRRRKAIVIQTFMVVFVLGVAVTFMAKPVYRTTARILVEGRSMMFTQYDASNPLAALFTPDTGHDIATQIEVLSGDQVLHQAYIDTDVPPGSAKLDVHQVNGTDVLELVVESNTPTYAERLAKSLPNTYMNYITGNRRTEVNNALGFTQSRLDEEKHKLLDAELAIQRFKERAHIADVESQRDSRIEEMTSAEGDVRTAEGIVAGYKALIGRLEDNLKTLDPKIVLTTENSNNQVIAGLHEKMSNLLVEREKLRVLYKDTEPPILQINKQIDGLQKEIDTTPPTTTIIQRTNNPAVRDIQQKIADSKASMSSAEAQLVNAQVRLQNATASLSNYSQLEREQAQLLRDADIHRSTVNLLLKSAADLEIRAKATHDPVQIISQAGNAVQVAPKKLNNLVYASLVGLMLGLCFALLQEFLDDRINSPEDARRIVGTPALGYVPMIENEEARLLTGSRGGSVLESYRVLRSNVRFAAVDTSIRSILVTSTVPGEGKSVTAYNLAVAMALDGRNVILVDTDLRRPTMHEKARVSQQPGLTNVLVGHTDLADAIKDTHIPGLRVLTAGPLPPNPAELLNSQAMRQLHVTLKDMADVIIFDSPPCLATADAQVLSAETDGVLYVVQFGEAKKSAVRHAVEMLRQARARMLGVVFNKIDLTAKRDAYYYGYYGYYGYYQTTQLEDGRPRRRRSTAEFEALLPKNNAGQPQTATQTMARPAEEVEELPSTAVVRDETPEEDDEEAS